MNLLPNPACGRVQNGAQNARHRPALRACGRRDRRVRGTCSRTPWPYGAASGWLRAAAAGAAFLSVGAWLQTARPAHAALTPHERAVDRGLAWLEQAQQPDGSWGSGPFRGSAAVTAQVVMAMIAAGSTPASGPHAVSVARGVEHLVGCARADGLVAGDEQAAHGPMYAHAFATTALAEAYGEADDDRLADVLVAARGLIERTQNDQGGWRYQPQRRDADLSVTAAMVVALRALHDGGFEVSADTVSRAADFLTALQNDDGGFRYLPEAGPSGAPRTAAALIALLLAGRADATVGQRGFSWLDDHPITLDAADGYALYGLAHETAARWRWQGLRTERTAAWTSWHAAIADRLVDAQRNDGSWSDPSCPEYGTAAAISILAMPRGLVPLFQPEPSGEKEEQR